MPEKYNLELYRLKAELCKIFADPKRLMIINELRSGEKSVGAMVDAIGAPQAVVSRNLAILRNRGIVRTRRSGAHIFYRLTDAKIAEACDLIHQILLEQVTKNRAEADSLTGDNRD